MHTYQTLWYIVTLAEAITETLSKAITLDFLRLCCLVYNSVHVDALLKIETDRDHDWITFRLSYFFTLIRC